MRTTRKTISFDHPFSLMAVDGLQPAGAYTIDIDEELIEGLSFLAYRRVATTIYLPFRQGDHASVQAVRVDPRELTAAHEEPPTGGGDQPPLW
ncbi:hypothetical protein [Microvirga sp. G4-2]|uniref:hypothetical protein n=1 Tax=Microvirga sp. G4-2 TaxID=3434467 RepID=UPI004043BD57